MVRYSLLRLLIFFGCVGLLWLLGLRSAEQGLMLVVGAALLSMVISYVVLRPFREDYSAQIAERLQARSERRRQTGPTDEDIEDAETGQGERYR